MSLLKPRQVAERLNVHYSTVRRMMADGTLPTVTLRAGKRKRLRRVRPEVLEKFIARQEKQA